MFRVYVWKEHSLALLCFQIRENHRQKEKALKDFSDYVARTSNYILLKAAKERQELSIDASRVANNYKQS